MEMLAARFHAALAKLPVAAGDRVVVAVSGGPDSVALLDLLFLTRESHRLQITVGHVDHGIHPASGSIAEQVAACADAVDFPFATRCLGLGAAASETAARAGRYAALDEIRREAEARWIMTAHHADDQAETVLMRLLHGSGPAGLAGMAPVRGRILRPLLEFTREELVAHATARRLPQWSDPANADSRHERAWLRQEILPLLHARVPDIIARIARSADQARRDRAAWDAALDAFPALAIAREPQGISVAAPPLAGYDSRLAGALLRAAARRAGMVLGARRTERVLQLVRAGRSGSSVPLGAHGCAELAFGRLHLVRSPVRGGTAPALVGGAAGELRWGGWTLRWAPDITPEAQPRNGMTAWFVLGATLRVRQWQPGDRIMPLRGTGRRLLVRCFQDARVPRSRRSDWPVIESAGEVVWVPGVCRGEALVPTAGSEALRVDVAYA